MSNYEIGSLVRCREREWIVLPSDREDVLMLRPIGGAEAEVCGIYLPIEGNSVAPAQFAPPTPQAAADFVAGQLLRDAARLSLRSGAGPFRSLGRLGVRPRPYQLVPLIMALRLDPIRLLIADDVGIGKTIEAALIARELLDRGEVRRLTVLCPPHLCDQWQRELAEKFAIDAVVVRSSTAAALERVLPRGDISTCPELVIVDEAHTATQSSGRGTAQQQRYELVRDLATKADRHVLLLTATPHSGIEDAFRSLLGLLAPRFARVDVNHLGESERDELARHFVQRRRADVQHWLGQDDVTPFPARESAEVTYTLARSPQYRKLFDDVYAFAREMVRDTAASTAARTPWRARVRYWAALALLRCVMSSPAAAETALLARLGDRRAADVETGQEEGLFNDELFSSYIYDLTEQEAAHDLEPAQVVEEGSDVSERARLRRFAARAGELRGANDPKLIKLQELVEGLLHDGFNPIVYCRYIATANYVAQELAGRVKGYGEDLRVLAVTGERSEEEREALITELSRSPRRVLIATDCLSEGINLQEPFDAVVHYDLPWNPNRLEQREGRVDRYGQRAPRVRTALLYGRDNPMDEAVMQVLLRKAVSIHRTLGISVPLPVDGGTLVEALVTALFQRGPEQLSLFDSEQQAAILASENEIQRVERAWDAATEREKESRTRFAQRRIKPNEVARELEESDAVLGDATTVERFVRSAIERLGAPLVLVRHATAEGRAAAVWQADLGPLPVPVRERVDGTHGGLLAPPRRRGQREAGGPLIAFENPAPAGVTSIGRNHPLTAALADYLLETALAPDDSVPAAARCGLIRTKVVDRRTTLLLLRVRMLIETTKRRADGPGANPSLFAEELVVCGCTGRAGALHWLDERQALDLFEQAQPSANVTAEERTLGIQSVLDQLGALEGDLNTIAAQRAERLKESHQRVRSATSGGRVVVKPHLPPDVLGVYVLLPIV